MIRNMLRGRAPLQLCRICAPAELTDLQALSGNRVANGDAEHPEKYFAADRDTARVCCLVHVDALTGNSANVVDVSDDAEFSTRSGWATPHHPIRPSSVSGIPGCSCPSWCNCAHMVNALCFYGVDCLWDLTAATLERFATYAASQHVLVAATPTCQDSYGVLDTFEYRHESSQLHITSPRETRVVPDLSWLTAGGVQFGQFSVRWTAVGATKFRTIYRFERSNQQFQAVPRPVIVDEVGSGWGLFRLRLRLAVENNRAQLSLTHPLQWLPRSVRWLLGVPTPCSVETSAAFVHTCMSRVASYRRTAGFFTTLRMLLASDLERARAPLASRADVIRLATTYCFLRTQPDLDLGPLLLDGGAMDERARLSDLLTLRPPPSPTFWTRLPRWAAWLTLAAVAARWLARPLAWAPFRAPEHTFLGRVASDTYRWWLAAIARLPVDGAYALVVAPLVEEAFKRRLVPWSALVVAALDLPASSGWSEFALRFAAHYALSRLPFPIAVLAHSALNFYNVRAARLTVPRLAAIVLAVVVAYLWWRSRPRSSGPPDRFDHPFYHAAAASSRSPDGAVKQVIAPPVAVVGRKARVSVQLRPGAIAPGVDDHAVQHLHPSFCYGPVVPSHPPFFYASCAQNELVALESRVFQELVPLPARVDFPQFDAWFRRRYALFAMAVRPYTFDEWNASFPPPRRSQHERANESILALYAAGIQPGDPRWNAALAPRVKSFKKTEANLKLGAPRLIQAWDYPGQVCAGPWVRAFSQALRNVFHGELTAAGRHVRGDSPFFWVSGAHATAEATGRYDEMAIIYVLQPSLVGGWGNLWLTRVAPPVLQPELWRIVGGYLSGDNAEADDLELGAYNPWFATLSADPPPVADDPQWARALHCLAAISESVEVLVGDASRCDSTVSRDVLELMRWFYRRNGAPPECIWADEAYYTAPRATSQGWRYRVPYDLTSGEPGTSLKTTIWVAHAVMFCLEQQGLEPGRHYFLKVNGDDHNIIARRGLISPRALTAALYRLGLKIDYEAVPYYRARFLSRRPYLTTHGLVYGPLPGRAIPKMFASVIDLHARDHTGALRRRYVLEVCKSVRKSWSSVPGFDLYLQAVEHACGDPADLPVLPDDVVVEHEHNMRVSHYHKPVAVSDALEMIWGFAAPQALEMIMETLRHDGLESAFDDDLFSPFVAADQPVPIRYAPV